jgi:GT2 family glycosyltransferase
VTAPATVSIVINTLDRANLLRRVLRSLDWLDPSVLFEVVVVVGPSTDDTDVVVSEWEGRIKVERVDRANLAESRNVGIRAADGDIVAFIDDDGVPEPEWLVDLIAAYDSDLVGAAGGWVYDYTGVDFQYRFGLADRLGHARPAPDDSTARYSFPGAFVFPHLIGTNSSFRRSALLEIGGFDEEYEYFLDETDTLLRVLDAGYRIVQVEGAYVHHKFAPSAIRLDDRFTRDRFSIIKNHTYFALRNAARHLTPDEIDDDIATFAAGQHAEMADAVERGIITAHDLAVHDRRAALAVSRGRQQAKQPRRLLHGPSLGPGFQPFSPKGRVERVVFTATDASRGAEVLHAARAFAESGGIAHAIIAATDRPHVDFVDGVWVHAVAPGIWADLVRREEADIRARRAVTATRSVTRGPSPATAPTTLPSSPLPSSPSGGASATVVIVSWRLFEEFRDCLDALLSQVGAAAFEVVVVLNGAAPQTVEMARRHPVVTHVVALAANIGFGAAANLGAGRSDGAEWLVFLNDDTQPDPHWLANLTSFSIDGKAPSVVTSLLLNFDGTIQEAGSRILSHGGTVQLGRGLRFEDAAAAGYLEPRRVDYGSAAAIAVRRSEFEAIGGFAPEYEPAYFEDVDLQLRIAERGGSTWLQPTAKVTHHLGRSTDSHQWFRIWAAARAGRQFITKWSHVLAAAAELDDPLGRVIEVPRELRAPAEVRDPKSVERESALIALAQAEEYHGWLAEQLEEARAGVLEVAPAAYGPSRRDLERRNEELLSRLKDLESRGWWGFTRMKVGVAVNRLKNIRRS